MKSNIDATRKEAEMTARMSKQMWATLVPMHSIGEVRALWPLMTEAERRAIVASAKAERAASKAWLRADRAIEAAAKR